MYSSCVAILEYHAYFITHYPCICFVNVSLFQYKVGLPFLTNLYCPTSPALTKR